MDEIILTPNGKTLVTFLQVNDKVWVGKDLIDETGIKGIYPVIWSLIKKGLVIECDSVQRDFTNSKGETKLKDYKTYSLTDKGRQLNTN